MCKRVNQKETNLNQFSQLEAFISRGMGLRWLTSITISSFFFIGTFYSHFSSLTFQTTLPVSKAVSKLV